ncbi:uncharacterized protein si:ch211-241j12.4 [Danio aesculapii]|uniref:uncharacterized protein si:ch211-241j12.4 n=1 Tax=Danio aesculapii TaxID=1142201 RepID=UPI0024C0DA44|nr:uncharacterized protein si:ch211-241j12.4 [Danio aesculapii]
MNGARAVLQSGPSSPALPAEHVLNSGAVAFPGVFDQYGCPLVLFPSEHHGKLEEELSKEEAVHFIHYCLRLHRVRLEETLLSGGGSEASRSPHRPLHR